jgi:hypothetical protein
MKFIAKAWASIGATPKASWTALAATKLISAYNAYAGYNLAAWQLNQGPTQANPAARASTGLTVTAHTFTGGVKFATLTMTPSGATAIWGFIIYRDTAAITAPNWNNCVAIVPADGANAVSYTDSPLLAGTYHYRIAVLNTDGKVGVVLADDTAVVT